jgi:arginase family enzyme
MLCKIVGVIQILFFLQLSDKVSEIIKSGRICITLGGDHSIGLGTVFGHAKSYPGLRVSNSNTVEAG